MARHTCISIWGIALGLVATYATDKQVLIQSQSPVQPSTLQTNKFNLRGVAEFQLTVNGTALGVVKAPYEFTYISKPLGQNNTFEASVCYFDGSTGTFSYSAPSGGIVTLRAGGSVLPRRR